MNTVDAAPWRRPSNPAPENGNFSEVHSANVPASTPSATVMSVPPTPSAPPPPPLLMNGNAIPTIRLKSEISDRQDPPAMLQTSITKDKKPFTYAPGGIDFSEIKSPRMQRRIIRNAQEPEDVVLPQSSTTTVNANSLPPSAVAAMTPQMAIPVFPKNNGPNLKKPNASVNSHSTILAVQPPPPPPPPSSSSSSSISSSPKIPSSHQPQPINQRPVTPPPPNKMPSLQSQPTNQRYVTPPSPPKIPTSHQTLTVTHNVPSAAPLISQLSSLKSPVTVTHNFQSSTPAPPKNQNDKPVQNMTVQTEGRPIQTEGTVTHARSIYMPPVTNKETAEKEQQKSHLFFPTLREAPTPWLQKQKQSQDNVAPWVNRNKEKIDQNQDPSKEQVYERKAKNKPAQVQHKDTQSQKTTNGTHIIPVRIEGSDRLIIQQQDIKKKTNSQRWGNSERKTNNYTTKNNTTTNNKKNNNNRVANNGSAINKGFSDNDSKPIQSRAFKVLQKITSSEDDTTDFNSNGVYNSEGVPLSQLRTLHLNNDDQAFMNQLKAQVTTGVDEEPNKKVYIPPSERQAEKELRKYMGSSIPSRSFRMLQAMTATQDAVENAVDISVKNEEANINKSLKMLSYPKPWPSPPQNPQAVHLLWQNYMQLYDLARIHLPQFINPQNTFGPIEILITGEDNCNDHKEFFSNENDVSLTVCIPLRKKSKMVDEINQQITLTELTTDGHEQKLDISELNHHLPAGSISHSSSTNSIDFWKEIADNEEDLYFKRSYTRPHKNHPTEKNSSESDEEASNNSPVDDSISENESYNVYEFHTHQPPLVVALGNGRIKDKSAEANGTSDVDEDSGMNSDICDRYTSETEAELEPDASARREGFAATASTDTVKVRKVNKYERATTHSRLYKLLLKTTDQDEKTSPSITDNAENRKTSLTLPLNNSSSSSGINSPLSPARVNETLVNELVSDLLKWKNDLNLQKISSKNLHELAVKNLQHGNSGSSKSASPAQIQGHGDPSSLYYPGCNIFPSKAFKNLVSGRSTLTNWPKCPLTVHNRDGNDEDDDDDDDDESHDGSKNI